MNASGENFLPKIQRISAEEQDDIEYARENHYDEAVFIEDSETVVIHEMKSGYHEKSMAWLGVHENIVAGISFLLNKSVLFHVKRCVNYSMF
jgi:hypothetical protein